MSYRYLSIYGFGTMAPIGIISPQAGIRWDTELDTI